ncbi:hypothetical protein MICA_420 [Micavibrio aeruginosavorus ARL-13]|uniref:Uncharacterized protein n=1 Tax=Micavibrio aeruginosavorus (strain ARL-13) TaxID=856793 RepID=G2KS80_MICAA|nr:hypothetical protein MICA_420 [Micavibrio aeruginosavorus ARL-13]
MRINLAGHGKSRPFIYFRELEWRAPARFSSHKSVKLWI